MAQQPGRKIRRVTNVDVVRGGGQFQIELTLDGTDTYVMQPEGEEISTLLRLFHRSGGVLFDERTEELTFEHYGTGA